jgi:hypothetical protein
MNPVKKRNHAYLLITTITTALIFSACAPAQVPGPTQDVSPLLTEIALTIVAASPDEATELEPTATPELITLTPLPEASVVPEVTSTPIEEATPTTIPQPTVATTTELRVLIQDDFSSDTFWYVDENNDYFGFSYKDNGYEISVNILNAWIWSRRGPDNLGDVRLEIRAVRSGGPTNGYYGVFCRFVDAGNYYALAISEDGSYGIAKMKDTEFEFLSQGVDSNSLIKTNGEANSVTGDCLGSQLTLNVNGVQLLQVEDTDFGSGASGAIAATRLSPGFKALFSFYRLSAPATP